MSAALRMNQLKRSKYKISLLGYYIIRSILFGIGLFIGSIIVGFYSATIFESVARYALNCAQN